MYLRNHQGDDDSDVSMPGSAPQQVRAVDRFQDANAASLAFSRRINRRQRAKDRNQMARVCKWRSEVAALPDNQMIIR
jgi:hypothetical protein